MKTRNKQSVKSFLRGAGFGLVVIFVLAFMIGCGKKDGGSKKATAGTGPGYNHTGGCVNCTSGTGNFVGAGVGNSTNGGLQLVMDFYLDAGSHQYNGSVVGQGRLHITEPVRCNSGYYMPVGAFDLVTLTPGYLDPDSKLISDLSLQGGGNPETQIYIQHASLIEVNPKYTTCDRNAWDYDELSAYFVIDRINGYPCGSTIYVEMQYAPAVCPFD